MADIDIIQQARERFKQASAYEQENREEAKIDLRFVALDQWEPGDRAKRIASGRIALVFDQINGALAQLIGRQRQTKPAIKVSPVTQATDEDADVLEGMIRHIEYKSGGDVADDTAFASAARCGFGFSKITTRYIDEESDDLEIAIKRIPDALSVYIDPDCKEVDASDMGWAFIVTRWSKDRFERQFPDALATQGSFYDGNIADWVSDDSVMVAEYWAIEETKEERKGKRTRTKKKVMQYLINGLEILDSTEWPGDSIPIIPMYGEEVIVDGKHKLISIIRRARDPQRLYNWVCSIETEAMAMTQAPKYEGFVGQFETSGQLLSQGLQNKSPYVEFDVVTANGENLPRPAWGVPTLNGEEYAMSKAQILNDIKAATQVFDPSMGNYNPKERSGKAIEALQNQGQVAQFPLIDSFTRYKRREGQILIQLIPKVYREGQEVRILGADMEQEILQFNSPKTDPKTGEVTNYSLDKGRFDVTVDIGPTYQNQMQQAAADVTELIANVPTVFPIIGDLAVKLQNWGPIGDQVSDRLKRAMPPQLQDPKDGEQPLPPQAMQQMQAMHQQNQQLVQELQKLQFEQAAKLPEIQSRMQIEQLKIASHEKMEMLKLNTSIVNAKVTASMDKDQADADRESEQLNAMMDNAHETATQAVDHQHEAAMSQQQNQFAAQQQQAQAAQDQQQQGGAQ